MLKVCEQLLAHVGESEWGGFGRSSVAGVLSVSDKLESKRFAGYKRNKRVRCI